MFGEDLATTFTCRALLATGGCRSRSRSPDRLGARFPSPPLASCALRLASLLLARPPGASARAGPNGDGLTRSKDGNSGERFSC